MVAQSTPSLPPIIAGRYQLGTRLGSGGMGFVHRAIQLSVGRPVAIKFLHRSLNSPQDERRFIREARVLAQMNHPNAVQLIDYGASEGRHFIVTELLEGMSLGERIRSTGPLPVGLVRQIAEQTLSALYQAHTLGVVHRDIKPDNIFLAQLVGKPDFAKLIDFGIAKPLGARAAGSALTLEGNTIGSPRYMSPEQLRGKDVTGHSDVYSLGLTLYEALVGKSPFAGLPLPSVVAANLRQPLPRLELGPEGADVAELVARCTDKVAIRRPDAVAALELLTRHRPTLHVIPQRADGDADLASLRQAPDDADDCLVTLPPDRPAPRSRRAAAAPPQPPVPRIAPVRRVKPPRQPSHPHEASRSHERAARPHPDLQRTLRPGVHHAPVAPARSRLVTVTCKVLFALGALAAGAYLGTLLVG